MDTKERQKIIQDLFEFISNNYAILDIDDYSIKRKNIKFKVPLRNESGFPSIYEEGIYLECGAEPQIKFNKEEGNSFRKIFEETVLPNYAKLKKDEKDCFFKQLKEFVDRNT